MAWGDMMQGAGGAAMQGMGFRGNMGGQMGSSAQNRPMGTMMRNNRMPQPGMMNAPRFGGATGPGRVRPEMPEQAQGNAFGRDYGGGIGPSAAAANKLSGEMSDRSRGNRVNGRPAMRGGERMPMPARNDMGARPMPSQGPRNPWQDATPIQDAWLNGVNRSAPQQGLAGPDPMEKARQDQYRQEFTNRWGDNPMQQMFKGGGYGMMQPHVERGGGQMPWTQGGPQMMGQNPWQQY